MDKWQEAQHWEKNWWNNCANTFYEDMKQFNLAPLIGLKVVPDDNTLYRIPLNGQSVLDIGGGPTSLLLKCENVKGTVTDPCPYPKWVGDRYEQCGIEYWKMKGEDIPTECEFDEVWIYNVLQHTDQPQEVIYNARKVSKIIRLFEWIDMPIVEGHPHTLTQEKLEKWLGGEGKISKLSGNGLYGTAFHGVFLGDHYDSKAER